MFDAFRDDYPSAADINAAINGLIDTDRGCECTTSHIQQSSKIVNFLTKRGYECYLQSEQVDMQEYRYYIEVRAAREAVINTLRSAPAMVGAAPIATRAADLPDIAHVRKFLTYLANTSAKQSKIGTNHLPQHAVEQIAAFLRGKGIACNIESEQVGMQEYKDTLVINDNKEQIINLLNGADAAPPPAPAAGPAPHHAPAPRHAAPPAGDPEEKVGIPVHRPYIARGPSYEAPPPAYGAPPARGVPHAAYAPSYPNQAPPPYQAGVSVLDLAFSSDIQLQFVDRIRETYPIVNDLLGVQHDYAERSMVFSFPNADSATLFAESVLPSVGIDDGKSIKKGNIFCVNIDPDQALNFYNMLEPQQAPRHR